MKATLKFLIIFLTLLFSLNIFAQTEGVTIQDANLRTKITERLGKPMGAPLTQEDLLALTNLWARKTNIQDLTGLEYAHNLKELILDENRISDLTPLAGLTELSYLDLSFNRISDITPLAGLTELATLTLSGNSVSDVTPLAGLTELTTLILSHNTISDISPLAGLTELSQLGIGDNAISDISPLVDLAKLESFFIRVNPLSYVSINTHIPTMQAKGVSVAFDNVAHPALLKISGDTQEGTTGTPLANPLVVEAMDANGEPIVGISVTFAVTIGDGTLSATTAITDSAGRAQTTFTLGSLPGKHTVTATAKEITASELTFTATAVGEPPDNISDVDGAADLVAYYPFDGNTQDVSGNGNHGQIVENTGTTDYVEGIFGDAIAFHDDAFVEMETSDSLHGDLFKTDPFTLAVWIYAETGFAYEHIWRSYPLESGHNTLFIFYQDGIISWRANIDGKWSWRDLCETDPGVFEAETWLHIAVTNDGEQFRIYADGEKVAETDFKETDGGNALYQIGDFNSGSSIIIDDYAVFSKALNEEEINLIMNIGVAQFLQTTPSGDIEDSGFPEDVNSDGIVNILDLVAVAGAFGQTGENVADVNGDGTVNILDLVAVAGAFGEVAAAPSAIRQQAMGQLTSADVQHWLTQARQENLTDPISQRGILFLEQLLAALTPKETALLANYPNPFNPETWIPYQLAKPADVTLTIYDINGSVVRTLDLGHQRAGMYHSRSRAAHWDGRNAHGEPVASGVYFYTLNAGDFLQRGRC